MRRLLAILFIIVFTIVSSVLFAGETKKDENSGFSVSTPNHGQTLGGKSGANSRKGLSNAAERSNSVEAKSNDSGPREGSDDASGGTSSK